jgi:hypothetical protein
VAAPGLLSNDTGAAGQNPVQQSWNMARPTDAEPGARRRVQLHASLRLHRFRQLQLPRHDGTKQSEPATVSLTVDRLALRAAPDRLAHASPGGGSSRSPSWRCRWISRRQSADSSFSSGRSRNGAVTIDGKPIASGQTYAVPIPANTQGVTLTVTRTAPGQATTIPLTIVDECGPWPTFVGGGRRPPSDRLLMIEQ